MTIGELKAAIGSLDDALDIVIAVPIEDEDGDTVERWFELAGARKQMNPDTAENYAHFACTDFR
jgi:hypothetical protein